MKIKGWAVIDKDKGFYKAVGFEKKMRGFSILSTEKQAKHFYLLPGLPINTIVKKVTVIVED